MLIELNKLDGRFARRRPIVPARTSRSPMGFKVFEGAKLAEDIEDEKRTHRSQRSLGMKLVLP